MKKWKSFTGLLLAALILFGVCGAGAAASDFATQAVLPPSWTPPSYETITGEALKDWVQQRTGTMNEEQLAQYNAEWLESAQSSQTEADLMRELLEDHVRFCLNHWERMPNGAFANGDPQPYLAAKNARKSDLADELLARRKELLNPIYQQYLGNVTYDDIEAMGTTAVQLLTNRYGHDTMTMQMVLAKFDQAELQAVADVFSGISVELVDAHALPEWIAQEKAVLAEYMANYELIAAEQYALAVVICQSRNWTEEQWTLAAAALKANEIDPPEDMLQQAQDLMDAITYIVESVLPHTLTVEGGSGGGSFFFAEEVPISAELPAGMEFDKWVASAGELVDPLSQNTIFIMPFQDAVVTAFFRDAPSAAEVVNGSGSGNYAKGETVYITAAPDPKGGRFHHWEVSSGSVNIENSNEAETSFVMPEDAVTVTAVYCYLLTVIDGSPDGEYILPGTQITIWDHASSPENGKYFDRWTAAEGTFTDATLDKTVFTMPQANVTVKANYKYTLEVLGGSGSGVFPEGAGTEVSAPQTKDGLVFDKWENRFGSGTIANPRSATTTFTMGDGSARIEATYTAPGSAGIFEGFSHQSVTRKRPNEEFIAAFQAVTGQAASFEVSGNGIQSIAANGTIQWKFASIGNASITAKDAAGNPLGTLQVNVTWAWWQWILVVLCFGWIYL